MDHYSPWKSSFLRAFCSYTYNLNFNSTSIVWKNYAGITKNGVRWYGKAKHLVLKLTVTFSEFSSCSKTLIFSMCILMQCNHRINYSERCFSYIVSLKDDLTALISKSYLFYQKFQLQHFDILSNDFIIDLPCYIIKIINLLLLSII